MKIENKIFFFGLNFDDDFFLFFIDKIDKIKILITKAMTPPNLLGIARKIAYANKKYHSGWMWIGVTNGLAMLKFSGSPRIFGSIDEITKIIIIIIIIGVKSFHEKNGWSFAISFFFENPVGLDDM